MALSSGQINDAFQAALHRPPTQQELAQYSSRGDLEGDTGKNQVIKELGGSAGSPTDNIIQTAIDSFTKQIGDYNAKLSQYDKANPFSFDQALATDRTQAAQQLDPYYSQTLNDLVTGIQTQRTRSTQDQNTLLSELNADSNAYTGQAKINLNNALEKSANGFADTGLYGSGAQLRDTGANITQSNTDVANYNRGITSSINKATTLNQRNQQDLNLQESQGVRNLNQEKSYNIENTALTNARNQQIQNEFARQQFAGSPPGVSPITYSNTLYSILGA